MNPYSLKLACKWLLLVCLLIVVHTTRAQTGSGILLRKTLEGINGELVPGASATVKDSLYFSEYLRGKLDTPYHTRNIITFQINEFSSRYLPATFNATVNLRLYYVRPDFISDSADQTLTINYDTAHPYTMRSSFVFKQAHELTVKILSLSVTDSARVIPALRIENEMELHPVYKLSCTEDAIKSVAWSVNKMFVTDSIDELTVNWPVTTGADVYDLEWAFIDSSALRINRYGSPVNPALIFANNTTRVTIADNTYTIPLMYDDEGVLYFRVRAVQERNDSVRVETNWSSDYTNGLGTYTFAGHERQLNWQSTITFAEDGKRKVVVEYMDGSLRKRQTVTKDNTTGGVISDESFYDYQGRPVIQVLAAPSVENAIKYTRNLNSAINGAEYDKDNYDNVATPAELISGSAKAMGTSSGTNKYFSAVRGASAAGIDRFIPDAEGYAFTETEYTPDNTGRISRQGGVGKEFKLGSKHEVKYFYGTPAQEDLDALFGTEAGDRSHYFKNMVSDANGQYAVNYVDMNGRIIATAMAGSPESRSLSDIPEKNEITVTDTLSGNNTISDLKLESRRSQLVTQDGYHKFKYLLTPPVLQKKDCNNNTVCYNGLYDLRITITDDAYNQHLGGKPFDTIIQNYNANTIIANCGAATPIAAEFELYLVRGSYEITKSLTISKQAMEFYRDSFFLKTNLCTTLEKVIEEQKKLLRDKPCYPDCKTCKDSVGEWNTFRVNYVLNAGKSIADTAAYRGEAWAAWQQGITACNELCGTAPSDQELKQSMLLDMTAPSGQYASLNDSSSIYSIFYHADQYTLPPYRQAYLVYLDEAGKPDLVFDDVTGSYVKPQQLKASQFAARFKASWAEALLIFHPEYCMLLEYKKLEASHSWDKDFSATDNYAAAKLKGYLNPTAIAGSPFPAGADPLALSQKAALEAKLNTFKGSYSMWSMAAIMTKCQTPDQACANTYNTPAKAFDETTLCSGDLDMAWRNFRELYLNVKRDIVSNLIPATCSGNPKTSANELVKAGKQPRFNNSRDALTQNGLDDLVKDNQDPQASKDKADAALQSMYDDNCKSYVQLWIQQLAPCKYDQAALEVIIPRLIQVCKEGSDMDHSRGASTVKPSSTNTYRSFEEVLNEYNQQHNITDPLNCNGLLITAPKPYGKQPVYTDRNSYTKPEPCECGKLNDLKNEYASLKRPGDINLSTYLKRTRQVNISQTDLDVLLDACNTTGNSSCSYLPKPIAIPALIQCITGPACANCNDIKTLYTGFTTAYPGIVPLLTEADTIQQRKNELFANYMNNKTGFGKQAWEYLQFIDSCAKAPSGGGTTTPCKPGSVAQLKKMVTAYYNGGQDMLSDIQRTPDGGFIMAGFTTGSQNNKDGYIIKTDSLGEVVWAKTYGGDQDDELVKLRAVSDGGYVAIGNTLSYCYDRGTVMIIKIDEDGNLLWNRTLDPGEGHGAKATDIVTTTEGSYVFAGLRTTQQTPTDWLTGMFTEDGELKWLKQIGSAKKHEKISLLEDGNTLVAAAAIEDATNYDAVVLKLNKQSGQLLNTTQYDLENRDNISGNIVKNGNGYKLTVISGANGANAQSNGVLVDLSNSGELLAANLLPAAGNTDPRTWLSYPVSGGGTFMSQSTQDVYWHKLRADNTVEWSSQVNIDNSDRLYSMLQNTYGSLAGVGIYNNQTAMLMLATPAGKTGCRDLRLDFATKDIRGAAVKKALAPQSDLLLGSEYVSMVEIRVKEAFPLAVIIGNCPGRDSCNVVVPTNLLLCGNASPVFPSVDPDSVNNCSDSTYFAVSAGKVLYNYYRDSVKNDFEQSYIRAAIQVAGREQFAVTYATSEYHYTLYYYDRAGNLVKTVPPAGVVKDRSSSWTGQVRTARAAGQTLLPAHSLATNYRYNTLNQLVTQQTPDGGASHYWYDRIGRLVLSQNAKQLVTNAYSYTLYDELGRITEVGEINSNARMTDTISRQATALAQWLTNANSGKSQITRTVYDLAHSPLEGLIWNATNLRNRVSWSAVYNTASDLASGNRASGTFYSYDIHGNVKTLLQDFNPGTALNVANRFKKISYKYDLISGKVNMVSYQPGEADAFYHRYGYDAENRLTGVFTSRDSVIWEADAYYMYYKHGPLARMVLGSQSVQGVDYAYTLQGWLKGVNSTSLKPEADMGSDGRYAGAISARDAFGFALHYFGNGDYKPVKASVHPFADAAGDFKPLYNGNVASMSVNLPKVGEPLLYTYGYDVLNRIVKMDASRNLNAATNNWEPIGVPDFGEKVTYDPNGNILSYNRKGNNTWAGKPLEMDRLAYHYKPGTNQLRHIKDTVPAGNYTEDIDSQDDDNYTYDANGNLVGDKQGKLNIEWNVYDKVRKITTTDGTVITYTYDVMGKRISKLVNGKETRYIRDADGDVLSVYVSGDPTINNGALSHIETHLYAENRLGIDNHVLDVEHLMPAPSTYLRGLGTGIITSFIRGNKYYELTNHLGNVLATVMDVKDAVSLNGIRIDYYEAKIGTAKDYYPFGMQMPGRQWSTGEYRYGFNGQESDNEIYGEGNAYTAEFWEYDPRIGRRWNLEPEMKKYPAISPYSTFNNSPIQFKDPNGQDPVTAIFEGATAFAIEAGLDFLTNLLLGDMGVEEAFNKVNWKGAAWEGAKATAISTFMPTGSQTAVRLARIGRSKIGKLTIKFAVNFTNEVTKRYLGGEYNDEKGHFKFDKLKKDFTYLAYSAAISTLLDAGLGDKADELFEKLGRSNAKLAKQYEKLYRNLRRGASQDVVNRRIKKINQAAMKVLKDGGKAAVMKLKNEAIKKAADETQKRISGEK
jgi:YD repeat-containing protein